MSSELIHRWDTYHQLRMNKLTKLCPLFGGNIPRFGLLRMSACGREQTLDALNPALEGECSVSGRKQALGRARLCLLGLSVRPAVLPVAVAITCKPFFTYRIKFAHLIFIENARQLLVCTAA